MIICPYGCNDGDNPMHMIGHDHEFIQYHLREMLGYRTPAFLYDLTCCIQRHNLVHDFPEQWHPIMRADGNKIQTGL